jgi:hypothetical protein
MGAGLPNPFAEAALCLLFLSDGSELIIHIRLSIRLGPPPNDLFLFSKWAAKIEARLGIIVDFLQN